jgi:SNF2 family DNA or RNA helicase
MGRIVVPHCVREFILLKRAGFNVPNPILYYYGWRNGKPFSVQKSTCALLTANPRAYVLNDMGTGKTKAALWAWDYLHSRGVAGKLLVVAPLSTLNFVWRREAFATLPHRKVGILHGSRQDRLDILADLSHDIYVINHDGVKIIAAELEKRTDIDVMVLDELAVYRTSSDRAKLMREVSERFTWVWGLTGAPMPNAPTDVWGQCRIVTPNTVTKYFKHTQSLLMTKINDFKWVPKPDAVEKAFSMMQPAVRFSLDDVVELPEVVHRWIDVPLTPDQKKVYDLLVRDFQAMVNNKIITAVNAGAAMTKLLQVSGGWVYHGDGQATSLDVQPRLDATLNIVESAARKVIIFVPFRHTIEGLSKVLDAAKIEHAIVHGDVGNRDEIFNLFQNTDKYKVLLAHPACMAHGITLTAADTIIWYGPLASLDIYEQANARITRVGQKHKQQVLHLQSTPVEKKIYRLLSAKQKIQDQLLDMFEEASNDLR